MKKTSLKKRILQHPAFLYVVSHILALVLRFIDASNGKSMDVVDAAQPYINGEKNAIFCFWHGRLVMQPFIAPKGRTMRVLVSTHRDGELITQVVKRFGVGTARGSRGKATTTAVRDMMSYVENGDNIGITPDGPRGPRHEAAMGSIWLAKQTSLPIIPVSMSATKAHIFNSWDRFLLPKPFGRIAYALGEPLHIGADDSDEQLNHARTTLEERLTALTNMLDARCGLTISKETA